MPTQINTRIQHKHDTPSNWALSDLIPLVGELIIYDKEDDNGSTRLKIGDGITPINNLAFLDEIDYALLAFNTNELVFDINTSSVLGQAILGQLVLA